MDSDFYILKPCKSTAAYEAVPKRNIKLDLKGLLQRLITAGYDEICDANVMIIVKKDYEVSIYRSGKLLIKTEDELKAKRLAAEIFGLITH